MSEHQDFNQRLIAEFRANEGIVGGPLEGTPLLLLTTTGAKSGAKRIAPLAFTKDGERFVIIASKGGAPSNPDWYHNLRANPSATVELGADRFAVNAVEAFDSERDRLFEQMAAVMPGFADYQRNTTRKIPVFTLERTN